MYEVLVTAVSGHFQERNDRLGALYQDGWRLIAVDNNLAYLERPLPEPPPPPATLEKDPTKTSRKATQK